MPVITYFAFLTLVANVMFGILLIFWKKLVKQLSPYILDLAIIFSTIATLGSLYLSNALYIPPCELCWFQRIFMYPLVIILSVAKIRKTPKIWEIVLPLSILGATISMYHYFLQLFPSISDSCGFATPCSDSSVRAFGYITIPWMSFTAFAFIIVFMVILKKYEGSKNR